MQLIIPSANFDLIFLEGQEKLSIEMIWINPGNFIMGSPQTEKARSGSESQFKVEISKGYWIGKFPVTQLQWNALMNLDYKKLSFDEIAMHQTCTNTDEDSMAYSIWPLKNKLSTYELNRPATHVNWQDAMLFCEKLNIVYKQILPEGYQFSLPTEAMWEFACRAGTITSRYNGEPEEDLFEIAWFNKNSNQKSHAVGLKKPNVWGLFDMLGNVYEWCLDDFMLYPEGPAIDWIGKKDNKLQATKTFRGGAWSSSAAELRAAARGYTNSDEYARQPWFGFRIALVPIIYNLYC